MDKKRRLMIISIMVSLIVILLIIMFFCILKPATFEVSFVTNGGTKVASQTIKKNEKVSKPMDPKKSGYLFEEWTYQGKTYNFSTPVTSSFTLTAKWVKVDNKDEMVVVSFDSDGGTTISNQIIKKNSKASMPMYPVKEGYTFGGWFLNNTIFDFETSILENIQLKAKWEKVKEEDKNTATEKPTNNNSSSNTSSSTISTIKKYTVSFRSNGGSAVSDQIIQEGGKVTRPATPTRAGYTFVSWMLGSSEYDFNSPVTSNMILVAKWNEIAKKNYTISFNSNGGTNVSSQTVSEGGKIARPSDPVRAGYTFGGWLLNGNLYDFNLPVTNNITLVAKWNQKNYTVKVTSVDQYSPDRLLTVYEDGVAITVTSISFNGVVLCTGNNMVVNKFEIDGIQSVTVTLTNGVTVVANIQ